MQNKYQQKSISLLLDIILVLQVKTLNKYQINTNQEINQKT